MDAISNFAARYARSREEEMSIDEYLAECKRDPMAYATSAQRMLAAIGEPEMVDTRNDPRLSRLFANKVIKRYPAFTEFYGMEESIEQVVSVFRHAAQGLEERKQILYLLGPVGGGTSVNTIAPDARMAVDIRSDEMAPLLATEKQVLAAVDSAVSAYKQDQDRIAAFLADCTEPAEGSTVQASVLFRTYLNWCSENNEKWRMANKQFGMEVKKHYEIRKGRYYFEYVGLCLSEEGLRCIALNRGSEPSAMPSRTAPLFEQTRLKS